MVRSHHQLNGHEFEQTLGDSETWYAAVHGVKKSRTQLITQQQRQRQYSLKPTLNQRVTEKD